MALAEGSLPAVFQRRPGPMARDNRHRTTRRSGSNLIGVVAEHRSGAAVAL